MHDTSTLFDAPNQHARPPALDFQEGRGVFHGYQEFEVTKHSLAVLPCDTALRKKRDLLSPYFTPRYLAEKSVLDLGANAAFFCFWAVQHGASRALAIDLDPQYLRMVEDCRTKLGFANIEVRKATVEECREPSDIVIALALIHWIYSCTECYGSLDAAVAKLASLTKDTLLVEWVDRNDPAIEYFGHLDWNRERISEPYTLEAFESALGRHFARYELIGSVSSSRSLYAAFQKHSVIEAGCPLADLLPRERVLSSRCLTEIDGIEYWSRLYECGSSVVKQTSGSLAERESRFLKLLDGEYFPGLRRVQVEDRYSFIEIEKIQGVPLRQYRKQIANDPVELARFFKHNLNLLEELADKQIVHRDIRPDNLLVRAGKPVLIDFGWAVFDDETFLAPPRLGEAGRPPDGRFCDVYAMGMVFKWLNVHRFEALDFVIEFMTATNPTLRITDIPTLRVLFSAGLGPSEVEPNARNEKVASCLHAVRYLVKHIGNLRHQVQSAEHSAWSEKVELAKQEISLVVAPGACFVIIDDNTIRTEVCPEKRRALPFLKQDEDYWGPPPDDQTGITELEDMRRSGAQFLVFTWPAFWWIDYYCKFYEHIVANYTCVLKSDRIVVFSLQAT